MANATRDKHLPWLKKKAGKRVAVIGDIMLDEYLEGEIVRISPEAPVPVHLVNQTVHRAGGAANVALNIALAGGETLLFGVCGNDDAATLLMQILKSKGVDTRHIVKEKDRPTIKKTRVTTNKQQIVRIDWERIKPISEASQNALLATLQKQDVQAFLISDYGKGLLSKEFLTEIFHLAEKKSVPVVVDPKGKDFSRYAGCYLITPNRKEACEALGLESTVEMEHAELAKQLQTRFKLKNILLTLGPKGMYFFPATGKKSDAIYLPTQAKEVFDVSGAGDTVAAIVSLALAANAEMDDAMHVANLAAGIVVGKWGTQPVLQAELANAYEQRGTDTSHSPNAQDSATKIKSLEDLLSAVESLKRSKKRIVFTNGCFDILHAGHITYLEKARNLGDVLIVGVNSDTSIRKIKGPQRPIVEEKYRLRLVAALGCVDYVTCFTEETPQNLIKKLIPDVLVKGSDWPLEKIVGADLVQEAGGVVEQIELVPGLSTSAIIQQIQKIKN